MAPVQRKITLDKGVNKDLLPAELEIGYVSDALNWRFRNGFAETVGGIAQAFNTPGVVPYWIGLYPTTSTRFLVRAGLAKVHCDDGTTATEITRIREPETLSSLVRDGGGSFVTVTTAAAHWLSTNDTVTISGTTASAGANFDITAATITVTGTDTFTYNQVGVGGATASVVGVYKVDTSSAKTDFTGAIDDRWTGGVLNGAFLLNNPVDGLYTWNGNTGTPLKRLFASAASASPIAYKADVTRPFKAYAIQLATTESGTKYPYRVRWSNAAEPGTLPTTFTGTAGNDAGAIDLAETPGFVIDCLPIGDLNIVYKQDGRYAMQYVGGNYVFRFVRLPGNDGLLARGCVASFGNSHVFLTASKDVMIHNGGEATSIAEGRVRAWLQANMDTTYANRSFLAVNTTKSEVWVCFPMSGQTSCTKALIWNWKDDAWSIRDLTNATYGTTGLLPTSIATDTRLIVSTTAPKIGLVDSGTTDFGAAITCTLERVGLHFDDPETVKTLHASRVQADAAAAATMTVQHGCAMTADADPSYASSVTHTQGTTNWCTQFANGGRYMAWKGSTTAAQAIKVRSVDVSFNTGGGY